MNTICHECKEGAIGVIISEPSEHGFSITMNKCDNCGYQPTKEDVMLFIRDNTDKQMKLS